MHILNLILVIKYNHKYAKSNYNNFHENQNLITSFLHSTYLHIYSPLTFNLNTISTHIFCNPNCSSIYSLDKLINKDKALGNITECYKHKCQKLVCPFLAFYISFYPYFCFLRLLKFSVFP